MSIIVEIGIALSLVIGTYGATDLIVSGVKLRRRNKALADRRAHQLLLAEKLAEPVQLLMTDRELAKDVYKELERQLEPGKEADKGSDDEPKLLAEPEGTKKKKAPKRPPTKRRT